MFKNILIPTDGSELSAKVADEGVKLAKLTHANVVGVYVLPIYYAIPYAELAPIDPAWEQRLRERTQDQARAFLAQMESKAISAGVGFEGVLEENNEPWKGVLDVARRKHCDLIAMAAHGRRGVSALLLGSETNKVLTHSKIPVLVYR